VGEFVSELKRLGYFKYCSPEAQGRMVANFLATHEEFQRGRWQLLPGEFASPGAALLGADSGRVVDLDQGRLARERARYALAAARPLLGAAGVEIGAPKELVSSDSYGVRLDGVTHEFFRLRNGRPALQGGEHEVNAARYVLDETTKLLNKVLNARGRAERTASLAELREQFEPRTRLAMVLLDDDLSYLMMWSPVIHNYCRPMRPDVFS
jgi:hypothetical protein